MSGHHHHPETWVTPENSEFLSSKLIILHKDQSMPEHTTGPEKEEVIVCCAGSIVVRQVNPKTPRFAMVVELHPGNYCFIPKNVMHSVHVAPDCEADHGIYVYVTNKVKPKPERPGMKADKAMHVAAQAIVATFGESSGEAEQALAELRSAMQSDINSNPKDKPDLEKVHEKVWDTNEMVAEFEVHDFLSPFVVVTRKSDGKRGSLLFQHHPRLYWGFKEEIT